MRLRALCFLLATIPLSAPFACGGGSGTGGAHTGGAGTGGTAGSTTSTTSSSSGTGGSGGSMTSCGGRYWDAAEVPTLSVPESTTGATYYVDGKAGDDANDGKSLTKAFKTIAQAVSVIAAGDTVRIRAGFYREGINVQISGEAGKPITFGPYGDGEVILDGSPEVKGWTVDSGKVWKVKLSFAPIGVVVNETPLKEVSHGQTAQVPTEGKAGVTDGSGKWYFDTAAQTLYADMGGGDPNQADIIVPKDDDAQEHVYFYNASHLRFFGLTVRGSGAGGVWGDGEDVTVESCNVKFNGKAGVVFQRPGAANNAVLKSNIYHNVLRNWPRGNNENTGGGWPSAIGAYANLGLFVRGNVVHKNGGEGILTYGTEAGIQSGQVVIEDNVVFDNWSVNVYIDNQPGCVVRRNFIYDHAPDFADLLAQNSYMTDDVGRKLTPQGVMLADEEWSSDATNGYANLAGTRVYDNIIASCKVGIRDYAEGTNAEANHGLKNTLIANNTIILPQYQSPDYNAGIQLLDNGSNNQGSLVVNNIVYGLGVGQVVYLGAGAGFTGVTFDNNVYWATSGAGAAFQLGDSTVDYSAFTAAFPGWNGHSVFADPLLAAGSSFTGAALFDPKGAHISTSSPAVGSGAPQSAFAEDFYGVPMATPWDVGAVQHGDMGCPN